MTTKQFLPLLTFSLFTLGACGLEKPPTSIKFPEVTGEKSAAPVVSNPSASSTAPLQVSATTPTDPKLAAGKSLYEANCGSCHEAEMMGAPKLDNKAAWAPRITQGVEVLVSHADKGFQGKKGLMPAKGGNPKLTTVEIGNAVAYIVEKAK
ncbi:MAG: c-type cytochrome [Chlorobiaceae bacterium]